MRSVAQADHVRHSSPTLSRANSPFEAWALRYAAYGWPVFPLRPRGKQPAITSAHPDGRNGCEGQCGQDGHGLYDATTDPDRIRAWWSRWPAANIGIRTGSPSGLLVLDVDTGQGKPGPASLARLEAEHGALRAREAVTGSGGLHLYLRHPGGTLGNSAGRLGPGLDTRADGGYVAAPPSVHPSGGTYSWQSGEGAERRILTAPSWLVSLLRPPPRPAAPPAPVDVGPRRGVRAGAAGRPARYVAAALEGVFTELAGTGEGGRNAALNRAAFRVGQLATEHPDIVDEGAAVGALEYIARGIGLEEREVSATLRSGLSAGRSGGAA